MKISGFITTFLALLCSTATFGRTEEVSPEAYQMLSQSYEEKANAGDPQSAYNLGFLYNTGKGVDKNLPEAFKWYLRSARGGLLEGQEKVSLFYYVGIGTVKSEALSYFWLLIARYNGGENLSSQLIRLEGALTLETRERIQAKARKCIESSYTEC